MKTNAFPHGFSRSALALAGLVLASALAPAQAQDGLAMRNIFGKIGLLPEEKDPIEYRERPALVVPKNTEKLRQPEPEGAQTKANGQWPVDPDVQDRAREAARRNQPIFAPLKADASEGGRLSLGEMARGRSARGIEMGETGVPRNDKDGVRASIQEMTRLDQQTQAPSYPPGTEPPRKYLTDPPTGLRIPSAGAPVGKRTQDDPTVDRFKVDNAWKRLD
jgi:hypothetical protein